MLYTNQQKPRRNKEKQAGKFGSFEKEIAIRRVSNSDS